MVAALGGPTDLLDDPGRHLPRAPLDARGLPRAAPACVHRPRHARRSASRCMSLGGGRAARDRRRSTTPSAWTTSPAPGEAVGPRRPPAGRRPRARRGRRRRAPQAAVRAAIDGRRRAGAAGPRRDRGRCGEPHRTVPLIAGVTGLPRPSCTSTSRAPRRRTSSGAWRERNGIDAARPALRPTATASPGTASSTSCAPTTTPRASIRTAPGLPRRHLRVPRRLRGGGRGLRRAHRLAGPRRARRPRRRRAPRRHRPGHRRRARATAASRRGSSPRPCATSASRDAEDVARARSPRTASLRRRLQHGRRRGRLPARRRTRARSRSRTTAGLGCSVHAGEHAGRSRSAPRSRCRASRASPTASGRSRIPRWSTSSPSAGSCWRCARRQRRAGRLPGYEDHPLPALRDAGVRVTLGSDDPPYFGSDDRPRVRARRERHGLRRSTTCGRSPKRRWMRPSSDDEVWSTDLTAEVDL